MLSSSASFTPLDFLLEDLPDFLCEEGSSKSSRSESEEDEEPIAWPSVAAGSWEWWW